MIKFKKNKTFKNYFLFLIMILILISFKNLQATTFYHGYAKETFLENNLDFIEDFRIRLENVYQGKIQISKDKGVNWQNIGKVLRPTIHANTKGYTASKWSKLGTVAATAVNAMHLKVGSSPTGDYGIVLSVLPREFLQAPRDYQSYLSPDSSIYTDIKAGSMIFGSSYAPFVGNPIFLENEDKSLKFLPINYQPATQDVLVIKVLRPKKMPLEIILENRFGGIIKIKYANQAYKAIGQVLRPLSGAGRFLGSQYAHHGRIRANHSGVLDISTADTNKFGGFQIVPANHGMSPEMLNARTMSQWLVVSPLNALDPSWEATAPFFSYYIKPDYASDDFKKDNWQDRLSQRYLVQVKTKKDKQKDLWGFFERNFFSLTDPLPAYAMRCFDDVEEIRILFPVYK